MSFKCEKCGRTESNTSMVGLVLGQIAKAVLKGKGIDLDAGAAAISRRFSSSFLNGLGVKCPKCNSALWKEN